MKEPKVQVGILFEPQIEFVLLNPYRMDGTEVSGKQVVTYDEGKILWNGRALFRASDPLPRNKAYMPFQSNSAA